MIVAMYDILPMSVWMYLWGPVPEHLTVHLLTLSVLMFGESVGGQYNISFLYFCEALMTCSALS